MRKYILSILLLFPAIVLAQVYQTNSQDMDKIISNKYNRKLIFINSKLTTHIVFPEPIKSSDISTDTVVGNQAENNVIQLKPKSEMKNNEYCATVTIIGERNIAYYDLIYVTNPKEATSLYYTQQKDLHNYENPSVDIPTSDLYKYSWAIYTSKRLYRNLNSQSYNIKMNINNIYAINNYFFIDFALTNNSNLNYSIDQLRVYLKDKKIRKATTSQIIELTPIFILNNSNNFKHKYRNVIVLNKVTFPEEKILTIEISEKQISGRNIAIDIEYSDILNADGISNKLMKTLQKN